MENEYGFIVLSRKMKEWRWWESATMTGLWIHILMNANWKDGWFKNIKVPRGSFITSVASLSQELDLSTRQLRTCLAKIEKSGEIEIKTTNRYTHIFIVNYDRYQAFQPRERQTDFTTDFTSSDKRTSHNRNNKQEKQINKKESVREKEHSPEDDKGFVAGNEHTPEDGKGSVAGKEHTPEDGKGSVAGKENTRRTIKGSSPKEEIKPPTLEDVKEYVASEGLQYVNAEKFHSHYESYGWKTKSGNSFDWKARIRLWNINDSKSTESLQSQKPQSAAVLPRYKTNPEEYKQRVSEKQQQEALRKAQALQAKISSEEE